jgi:hypothetical protein
MYASLAVLFTVTLVLVYQWMVLRKTPKEGYADSKRWKLVYVHMEGCGYCVQFSNGAWAEIKGSRQPELNKMGVVVVDYDREDPAFVATGIRAQAFPTIVMYDENTRSEVARYSGARTADAIVAWAAGVAQPAKA